MKQGCNFLSSSTEVRTLLPIACMSRAMCPTESLSALDETVTAGEVHPAKPDGADDRYTGVIDASLRIRFRATLQRSENPSAHSPPPAVCSE